MSAVTLGAFVYGLVNQAVQDLVRERFGDPVWARVTAAAGIEDATFLAMSPYDDDVTYRLVGAASEVLGLPAAEVLEAFGEYWMTYSAEQGYGELLTMMGADLPTFLAELDVMHDRLRLTFPDLRPPSIWCGDVGPGFLTVHYASDRDGLAPFVVGLLRGAGRRFGLAPQITLLRAKADGHDHDEFLVRWPAT